MKMRDKTMQYKILGDCYHGTVYKVSIREVGAAPPWGDARLHMRDMDMGHAKTVSVSTGAVLGRCFWCVVQRRN